MKDRLKIILPLLMLIGLMSSIGASGKEEQRIKVGDQLPSFTLKTASGEIKSEELKGKVVLINFFATWCGPCVAELPVLAQKVWKKYKNNKEFKLLVVGREHSEDELKTFAEKRALNLPFYPDPKREVYKLFAPNTIPRNYVIDKTGKVVYASTGYSPEEFEKMLSLLKQMM